MFPDANTCFRKLEHLNKYFQNENVEVECTVEQINQLSKKFEIRIYNDCIVIWN